jgi:hypothetical protein
MALIVSLVLCLVWPDCARGDAATVVFSGQKKRNNLVSDLLEVASISAPGTFQFTRPSDGWTFFSAVTEGSGSLTVRLEDAAKDDAILTRNAPSASPIEGVRYLKKGEHRLRVNCRGGLRVLKLSVRAIPDLLNCGLRFDPAIKAFGHYDMAFFAKDVSPNVTTMIVPSNIQLPKEVIDDWHRQGKHFVAEVGLKQHAKSPDDNFQVWTGVLDRVPFLDGIIINEFGMNRPSGRPLTPRRRAEQQEHKVNEQALAKMRADPRYRDKDVYVYFGGSGNLVNYEDTGTTFVRGILNCNYRVALERYVFERSSPKRSEEALQALVEGIVDWNDKEPGVKPQMVIAFGLFSMPPGGINKLPNVDYHVWMDQQMHVVANHPAMSEIGGLEWWTSILADEETVRFVGKLYRHYAIEGKTQMFTRDPLFLPHLQNADFEKGTENWTLHAADAGSIEAKSFPRYGRIEGRYMGLGRPADPEHIGDTLLWMKRSPKGPNSFSQTVKSLEPGRLYSLEMFSCDYQDLVHPKAKKIEEANKFLGTVKLDGVDLDTKRSFTESYASNPEPKIPVWITYHWLVFRAKGTTASLTVSDWPDKQESNDSYGQEQAFNFLELQPYHE